MSILPRGWAWTTLGQVADWGSGGTPKAKTPAYYDGHIPWAVIGDLTDGPVNSTAQSITEEGLNRSSAKVVGSNAVLIAMYGSMGKLGLPTSSMATNQAIAFAIPGPALSRIYLFYYLMHVRKAMAAAGRGTTQLNLSQTILKAWPIPIPPLAEQERIVAAIEEEFSRLDTGVAALESARRRLQRMRDAALQQSVPTERDGWAEVTVGATIKVVDYRGRTPPFADEGIPHLRSFNVKDGEIRWEGITWVSWATYDRYMSRGIPSTGDLLFTTEAPMGEVAPIPSGTFCMAQRMMLLKPKPSVWRSEYLMYQLRSPWFQEQLRLRATGTTVKGISSRNFRPMRLFAPSLDLQQVLEAEIRSHLAGIKQTEAAVQRLRMRSRGVRRGVLRAAFAGQLVAQDPSDEPASVHLGRVDCRRAPSYGNGRGRAREGAETRAASSVGDDRPGENLAEAFVSDHAPWATEA